MKFLVDAQLPIRLAHLLREAGYDTLHTRDLPNRNLTSDREIDTLSLQQELIVITKDSDFVESFLLRQQPYKLLLVTTGNITNRELEGLFLANLSTLAELFEQHFYIEISRSDIIVHQ